MKEITIIGMGPGAAGYLTEEGKAAIEQAEVLIGSERLIKQYPNKSIAAVTAKQVAAVIEDKEAKRFAVLMSGDTGFYSGTKKLIPLLKGRYRYRILPGISSIVYLAAQIGVAWETAQLISLHGKKQTYLPVIAQNEYTFLLTQGNAAEICRRMTDFGLGNCEVWIGENLSYADEKISHGMAFEFVEMETAQLTVMAVFNQNEKPQPSFGILDTSFVRGNVPMTKREIRASIVSRMALSKTACVYDIGAGTGAVSVELAMQALQGAVYAIEKNSEGCELVQQNAKRFGIEHITIVQGKASEVITELPVPEAAFIGGSAGELEKILRILLEKNPKIHIVLTAVTLETLYKALELFQKYGFSDTDMVQIAVTEFEKRGRYHMMSAQNPVFLLEGRGSR